MRVNADRRTLLLDHAIALLAREGARGLSYRALDVSAEVPAGTASNYFRSREVLLDEVGRRVHERLRPSAEQLLADLQHPPSRKRVVELMQALMRRVLAEREVYLALTELRLEATRNPTLHATLAATLREDFAHNVAYHEAARLPGGAREVALLVVAMNGLIIDRLTTPEVLPLGDLDRFVATLVERLVPARVRRRRR